MSTLGAGARSLRAPAMPSITGRCSTGSNVPGWVTGPATGVGLDHVDPPFVDFDISSKLDWPIDDTVPMPNTYAVPVQSVRIVHPSSWFLWPFLAGLRLRCC